jgi:hypothetical protein
MAVVAFAAFASSDSPAKESKAPISAAIASARPAPVLVVPAITTPAQQQQDEPRAEPSTSQVEQTPPPSPPSSSTRPSRAPRSLIVTEPQKAPAPFVGHRRDLGF